MKLYTVETKCSTNPRPGYAEYKANSKADAIKQARHFYNTFAYDRENGRMIFTVIDEQELD